MVRSSSLMLCKRGWRVVERRAISLRRGVPGRTAFGRVSTVVSAMSFCMVRCSLLFRRHRFCAMVSEPSIMKSVHINPWGTRHPKSSNNSGWKTGHKTPETNISTGGACQASVDALGNRTSFTYNRFGSRTSEQNALGLVTTYSHDANNNQVSTQLCDNEPVQ